jgi:hypothetical protein
MNQLETRAPESTLEPDITQSCTADPDQPQKKSIWSDAEGYVVMGFGVILPGTTLALMAGNGCHAGAEMIMRHPIETIVQLVLAGSIPFGNFVVWRRLCDRNYRNAAGIGALNGMCIGSSLLAAIACLAAYIMKYPLIEEGTAISHELDATICGLVALGALCAAIHLSVKSRNIWETNGAKIRQMVYALFGMALSFVAITGSEGRQAAVRFAEQAAVNETGAKKADALSMLQMLDSEREIRMDINDARSGGLSGMFLRLDPSARRQLYFAVAAKPYEALSELAGADDANAMITNSSYDKYLASNVVGEVLPGFSLARSQISGTVNAKALTSEIDWTMVLKNKTYLEQEARAEFALPPGAVVSDMTLWMNGVPKHASIAATEQAEGAYKWVVVSKRDPALIRYLGKGRVLVQCFPVPANKEMKISLSMAAPMKLDSGKQASLMLPRLVSSNFSSTHGHDLRLRSAEHLDLESAHLSQAAYTPSDTLYVGNIKDQDTKTAALSLLANRPMSVGAFAAKDPIQGGYSIESVKQVDNTTPDHLVVVVDGSAAMKEHQGDIADMLKNVSKFVPTTVAFANTDDADAPEPTPVAQALEELSGLKFAGGHDNLPAVIKASEAAGEKAGGAVLWIHGPQASFNEEIYITSKAASKPAFYELAVDDGWTNTNDFFRNHREIGPLIPVTRNGKLRDDLNRFIAQWTPRGQHYSVQLVHMYAKPNCTILTGKDAVDLNLLGAANTCKQMLAEHRSQAATKIATSYHILTPVTAGVVLEKSSDYEHWGLQQQQNKLQQQQKTDNAKLASNDSLSGFSPSYSGAGSGDEFSATGGGGRYGETGAQTTTLGMGQAPNLQGAANGTIGPMGSDATYVTGLNTAGTVRVNNLANLEALLNLLANGAEILGLACGLAYVISAVCQGFKPRRFAFGTSLMVIGLLVPGTINWLVASARDANLFN